MDIREELLKVIDCLQEAKIEYAICGGIALAVHGCLRLTEDIDILIQQKDIDLAKKAVSKVGFRIPAISMTFNANEPTESIVHRVSKFEGEEHLILDLMIITPFLESVWNGREQYPWEGRKIQVVSALGLAKMN